MIKKLFTTRLGQNVLTNYLAMAWLGVLSLALIPVYVNRLGPGQWGVVAICITVQGFLGLLDAGLGQIMQRDIARVEGDRARETKTFRVFSRLYLGLGIAGFLIGQMAAGWFAHFWVQAEGINTAEIESASRLVLIQFLFQFSNNAHIGYWNGLQHQKTANIRQCGFQTAKHAAAVALVLFWRPDAFAYLIPFAAISAIEWSVNRYSIRAGLAVAGDQVKTTGADLYAVARRGAVLGTGVLIGMLVSQMDRIILSRTVALADYGTYVIVANLGLAFLQLQYPLVRALFPRIMQDETATPKRDSSKTMMLGMLVLCVIPCVVLAGFAPAILQLWIGNPGVVEQGAMPLRLIMLAVAMNAVYQVVYLRILALNVHRFVLFLNAFILLPYVLVVPRLAIEFGIVAGGIGWIFYTFAQLLAGLFFLKWYASSQKDIAP